MPIKLILTKETESASPQELRFDQEVITIGRDQANVLFLPDPDKKLVSRRHAKIDRRDHYELTDLGSRNATYLNDVSLEPERPQILQDGDRIKIGDFLMQFFAIDQATTIVVAPEPNPFLEDAETLTKIFGQLEERLAQENSTRRDLHLQEALLPSLERLKDSEAGMILLKVITGLSANVEAPPILQADPESGKLADALKQTQFELQRLRQEHHRLTSLREKPEASPPPGKPKAIVAAAAKPGHLDEALDILLEAVAKLTCSPDQFRSEFEGVSMFYDKERGSAKALHERLFNPALSKAEAAERLANLKQEIERGLIHQVALLEGYKTGVAEGARQLLQTVDPEMLQKKLAEKTLQVGPLKIPYRYVPLLFRWKWLELCRQRHQEQKREDRGIIETRLFRPAFLKAYHEVTDLARRKSGEKAGGWDEPHELEFENN